MRVRISSWPGAGAAEEEAAAEMAGPGSATAAAPNIQARQR